MAKEKPKIKIKKPLYQINDWTRTNDITYDYEEEEHYRSPFWRDRSRIIHSPAFRRLRGKTQLFPNTNNDFFRCRLTHSLEVANIGKTIANRLNFLLLEEYDLPSKVAYADLKHYLIDTDLVELSCLAHDLGHPPFGHQGEEILNQKMAYYGGFEGNAQTFRILTVLEKKLILEKEKKEDFNPVKFEEGVFQDRRKGLNLTYRSLASVIKYNRVISERLTTKDRYGFYKKEKGIYYADRELFEEVKKHVKINWGDKDTISIEAQIMDIADDIAYSTYDLEDAFKGGFLHPMKIFAMSEDFIEKLIQEVKRVEVIKKHNLECTPDDVETAIEEYARGFISMRSTPSSQLRESEKFAQIGYQRNQFASKAISDFITDIKIDYNLDDPPKSTVSFSNSNSYLKIEILKKITYLSQIESSKLKIVEHRGQKLVGDLFKILIDRNKNRNGQFLIPDIRKPYNTILAKIIEYEKNLKKEREELEGWVESIKIAGFSSAFEEYNLHKYEEKNPLSDLCAQDKVINENKTTIENIINIEKAIYFVESHRHRLICDFIASMTDRYAIDYLDRLTSIHTTRSIFSHF